MGNILKAISRLSLKDKVILLACFCLALGFAFMGLLNLSMKGIVSGDYPSAELAMVPDAQQYEKKTYGDLPYEVAYPLSDIVISVGGTEGITDDFGSSVIYDSDYTIITFCIEGDYIKTVNNHFADLLGKKKVSSYASGLSEHGYLNTLELYYEAGGLELNDAPRYILSYVYKDIGVSVVTKDKAKLRGAKKLLDRLAMTIGNRTTKQEGAEEISAPSVSEDKNADTGNSERRDFPVYSNLGFGKSFDDVSGKLGDGESRGNLVVTTSVLGGMGSSVFAFEYTNMHTMPEDLVLISPSGEEYAADYVNDEQDGRILFYIDEPEEGEWTLSLSSDERQFFGGYMFSVYDRQGYEASFYANSSANLEGEYLDD